MLQFSKIQILLLEEGILFNLGSTSIQIRKIRNQVLSQLQTTISLPETRRPEQRQTETETVALVVVVSR